MSPTVLMRGASACALMLVLSSEIAEAQQALPTIEIGAPRRATVARGSSNQTPTGRGASAGGQQATPGQGGGGAGPTGPAAAKPLQEDNTTYHPENAVTALKTNTPIMNTPASVQVVPRAVLQDQAVTQLSQAVNNVSGVIAPDGNQATGQWIRGFLTYSYYRDGVRMDQNITNTALNPADADRIEVLKGPASILYGSGDPGGLVNMVTKRPLETPYTSVQQLFGSWSYYRTTVDTTGPITKDNTILYRFNGAWDNSHYFPNNSYNRDFYLAPKVLWNIDAHTSLTTYATYRKSVGQDISLEAPFTLPGPNSSFPLWAYTYGYRRRAHVVLAAHSKYDLAVGTCQWRGSEYRLPVLQRPERRLEPEKSLQRAAKLILPSSTFPFCIHKQRALRNFHLPRVAAHLLGAKLLHEHCSDRKRQNRRYQAHALDRD